MGWVLGLFICVLYCWLGLDFGLIIRGWLFRGLDGWCGLLSVTLTWVVGFVGCWFWVLLCVGFAFCFWFRWWFVVLCFGLNVFAYLRF